MAERITGPPDDKGEGGASSSSSTSFAMPAAAFLCLVAPRTWDRASILDNPGMRRLPTVGDYCGRPCAQCTNVSV